MTSSCRPVRISRPLEYYEVVDNAIELHKKFKDGDPNRNVLEWSEFMKLAKVYRSLINRRSAINNNRKRMKSHATRCKRCERLFVQNEARLRDITNFLKCLGPSIIKCKYRLRKRHMCVTPQWKQITESYLTLLNKLHRIETSRTPEESGITADIINKVDKNLKDCELLNKSIKDQTQGRRSFIKQEASPGRYYFTFRCTVLPSTPDMDPDEIAIPHEIYPHLLENCNRFSVSLIFKRDPVICQYSIHSPEKIRRVVGRCVLIHPYRYKSMNLDIDGDTVIISVCICESVSLELLLRLNCRLNMYVHFAKTRMEFSQTHALRLHDPATLQKLATHPKYGRIFSYITTSAATKSKKKTVDILNHMILILVQLYDSMTAYDFLQYANSLAFEGSNGNTNSSNNNGNLDAYFVENIDDNICDSIIKSGAKGSSDILNIMKHKPQQNGDIIQESLAYAQKYITNNNSIAKVWQTESRMLQIIQNVLVDSDMHLRLEVGNKRIVLGPVDNFMPHSFKMNETVALLIDDNIF